MRIVVTAAGGSGGRFLTEALRAAGHYIIGTDCDPMQAPLSKADEMHILPRGAEDSYLAAMSRLAENLRPDLIMPQSDPEVAALAGAGSEITDYVRLFLPEPQTVRVAQDKWESYETWDANRVPCAYSFLPEDSIRWDWARCAPSGVWIRRRSGAGGAGAIHVSASELRFAIRWMELMGGQYIGGEYLPGTNCVCDLVFWRGQLVAWAGRKVLAWQMAHASPTGITGASKVTHLYLDEKLRDVAEAAVRALPGLPHGIFGVDTIQKADGSYWVTEVNAGRFNAPGPALYMRASLNLAGVAAATVFCRGPVTDIAPWDHDVYAMLRGQDTEPVYLTKAEWEKLCVSL